VTARPGIGRLHVPAWDLTVNPDDQDSRSIAEAYRALRSRLGIGPTSPIDLELSFQIPTGAGLGSSAAMAVALARALACAHQLSVDDAAIAEAAMASETVIHGRPSGLDHTMAIGHGFGVFTRGSGLLPVRAPAPIRLIVGHTGRERDTKGRVARIAELRNERSDEVRARFDAIAGLVESGRAAVERGAFGELGEVMNENQRHLSALEASCPEIDRLCRLASDAGAVGAKLTGGGGGGCVIALAPGRERAVEAAFTGAGFRAFQVEVGA
jgi:mevalonate kinase